MLICSIYPAPMRLDRFLRAVFDDVPQSTVEKICRKKQVRVNGKACEPKTRVMVRDEVEVLDSVIPSKEGIHKRVTMDPLFQGDDSCAHGRNFFSSLIIYDSPDFCIIHKPYGLSSQGGPGITESVDKLAGENYWIVHRLDRNTEGLMILAKNRPTATKFGEMFKNREIEKYYFAIVRGHPEKDSGTIDLPLKNVMVEGDDKMIVDPHGQKATTLYRVVKTLNRHHTLIMLKPLTGRKHQIRAHLAAMGMPILGDMKYGKRAERMHLYAYKVVFPGFEFCLPLENLPYTQDPKVRSDLEIAI